MFNSSRNSKQRTLNSSEKPKELAITTCHFKAIKLCDSLHTSEAAYVFQDVRVRSHAFPSKA